MSALLTTVFVASLLGSLHCVGMCGPFALLAGTGDGRAFRAAPTVAYSLGRWLSYTAVGVLFGSLGLALNQSVSVSGWQQSATWVAGGLMVVVGGIALARQLGWSLRLPRIAGPLERTLGVLIRWGKQLSPVRRAALIGLATSLMPCGWLYVFALAAAGTASPVWGGVVMSVFWAGTVPIMAALGLGWGRLSPTLQAKVPITMAILVIGIGLFTIVQRSPVDLSTMVATDLQSAGMMATTTLPAGASAKLKVPQTTMEAIQQLQSVDSHALPCCQTKPAAGPGNGNEIGDPPVDAQTATGKVPGTGP